MPTQKLIYLLLCIVGTIVPYASFLPWVAEHGLRIPLMIQELTANRISMFFGADVLVSAVVVLVFTRSEAARLGVRHRWLTVAAVLTVGVSLALPLFLYLREDALATKTKGQTA